MGGRLDVDAESLVRGSELIERAVRGCDHRLSEVVLDSGDADLTATLTRFGRLWSDTGGVLRRSGEDMAEGLCSASRAYHAADIQLAKVVVKAASARSGGSR